MFGIIAIGCAVVSISEILHRSLLTRSWQQVHIVNPYQLYFSFHTAFISAFQVGTLYHLGGPHL